MKTIVLTIIMLVHSFCYAQVDNRSVVGVAKFTCDENDKYAGLVTEKVVEMLTNTKRFRVVDRTSNDKIRNELEFQKSEAFIDSENLVEQDIAIAAEKMITGHITKIPVYAIKNSNGTVKGYKSSVAFQMKVVDVATGLSTEATSFQGQASDLMLSPESSVVQAMLSMQFELEDYFRRNFPVSGKILRVLGKNLLLTNCGVNHGIKVGDKFNVEIIEMLEGKPYPSALGEITVVKLSGEDFSECTVSKKNSEMIISKFNSAQPLICTLIIK